MSELTHAQQALIQAVLDVYQSSPNRIQDDMVKGLAQQVLVEQLPEEKLAQLLEIKRRAHAVRKEFDAEMAKLPHYAVQHVHKWLKEKLEKEEHATD